MTGITIPIILAVVALITALSAYRGIRRGAARFYTLERESMLRRASFTLLGSIFLFLAAIALLVYSYQQLTAEDAVGEGEAGSPVVTATSEPQLETQPPTPTTTPTPDPSIPTTTPTAVICRAIVDGTSGSGLTLRDAPGGADVSILPDGSILTLLEAEPEEANGFMWRNVRTVAREEGWVVEDFLKIGDCGS
jgi:hypothetical protein